jgi:hypothetical protein
LFYQKIGTGCPKDWYLCQTFVSFPVALSRAFAHIDTHQALSYHDLIAIARLGDHLALKMLDVDEITAAQRELEE